jgi:glycosyltransferase involved in cell wall biosynthesis
VLELHDVPGPRAMKEVKEADAVIVVSQVEAERLRAQGYAGQVQVAPNGVDLAYWGAVGPSAEISEAPVLLFPAAFNWPPNEAAARVLVEQVLAKVRVQIRGAQVVLAGRRPGPGVRALAQWPGVTLVTDPANMRPLFARASLVVVPTSETSGTRLKILQALAAGRAVVSTPEGAAGLDLVAGRDLAVAPLVDEFAAEVVRLLNDAEARAALAAAGPAAVQGYGWQQVLEGLERVYEIGD